MRTESKPVYRIEDTYAPFEEVVPIKIYAFRKKVAGFERDVYVFIQRILSIYYIV